MIPKLSPPRTPPINSPTPKGLDTINAETYNFPSVLQSLADNTNEDHAIISEVPLNPSIDCIPSEYTIDNQFESTNNAALSLSLQLHHSIQKKIIPSIQSSSNSINYRQPSQFKNINNNTAPITFR